MVWAGFCAAGKLDIKFVEGTLNAETYIDVLERRLVPFLYDCGLHDVIFQQCTTPAYTSQTTKEWFNERRIAVLP